jgi:signal transduction histidine kinase
MKRIIFIAMLFAGSGARAQSLDFSRHDFDKEPITTLTGTWARYWQLLDPRELAGSQHKPDLVQVPEYWKNFPPYSGLGVATYRVTLKMPAKPHNQLGLHIKSFRCAGKIFINGEVVDSLGVVGTKPKYRSQLGSLLISLPDTTDIECIIQVANFDYREGGLMPAIELGKVSSLNGSILIKISFDIFFSGAILAIAAYLFTMFLLHRNRYSFLFLSLICIAIVLRSMSSDRDSLFLPRLFPELDWAWCKKIEFFSTYSIVAFFPLYISQLFPQESNRKVNMVFVVVAILLCVTVILTPHYTYVRVLDVAHVGLLAGFVYTFFISVKAWRNNNPEVLTLLIGVLIALPFVLMEILKNSALKIPIPFAHLVELGIVSFLIFEVYVLAKHYSMSYKELESLVKVKTHELTESNLNKEKANSILETTLANLKSTQAQLIQSEKMASLGELTAGIAHEIQNPLNFVNNFSEVNKELIKEIQDLRHKTQDLRDEKLEEEILNDIAGNLEKINHHGKRAENIVKGMLQHSRTSTGQTEPTDINALCDEYLRLAYHGLRAKDKSFNSHFETDFDSKLSKVNVVPQDIGRVILNLINNAFYAVNEKAKLPSSNYEPRVTVSTKNLGDKIEIKVQDNGTGIPDKVKEKIFQPFFTTKPTGQGTGLGLSLSYDIVKTHGGELGVTTKPGEGSAFSILLSI